MTIYTLKFTSSEVVKNLEVITEIWENGKLIDKKLSSVTKLEKNIKKIFNVDIYFTLKHDSLNKNSGELTYSIKKDKDLTSIRVPFKSKQDLDKYMLSSFINHNNDSFKNYKPGDEIELWGVFRYTSNIYPFNSLTDMAKKSKWSMICKFKNKI